MDETLQDESPSSPPGFSDTHSSIWWGYLISAWWKSRLPTGPLMVGKGAQFYLWCFARVKQLLSKNFVLVACFSPRLSLYWRFLWDSFLFIPVDVPRGGDFMNTHFGIHGAKRKSTELTTVILWVRKSVTSLPPSLYLSVLLWLFHIECLEFLSCTYLEE